MNIGKILAELRSELETLNDAILSLEKLQNVAPRRGRPRTRGGALSASFAGQGETGGRAKTRMGTAATPPRLTQ